MGIPIEGDEPLPSTDDEGVVPEPAAPHPGTDPEAPEADAGWRVARRSHDFEVPDNDAIDQALEVPLDDFPDDA
jgi:hypothetical protein